MYLGAADTARRREHGHRLDCSPPSVPLKLSSDHCITSRLPFVFLPGTVGMKQAVRLSSSLNASDHGTTHGGCAHPLLRPICCHVQLTPLFRHM